MAKRKRHAAKRKTSRQKEKDSKQKEKLAASCHLGQWDDLIISQLQAIFQLFLSYLPLRKVLARQLISMQTEIYGVLLRKNVCLLEKWCKFLWRWTSGHLKTSKFTKKCMASGRSVGQRPDCHTFLCKFRHFQMAVSQ